MPLDQPEEEFEDKPVQEKSMSFFEHIDELRRHLMRSALAVVIFSVVGFIYHKEIFNQLVLGPMHADFWTYKQICKVSQWIYHDGRMCFQPEQQVKLINMEVQGQFLTAFKIALVTGLILAFPFIVWQLWSFVKPALSIREVRKLRGMTFYVVLLFLIGVLFSYFIIVPMAMQFLIGFSVSPDIQNFYTISNVTGFITVFSLITGVVFELPLLIYFLTRIGLVTTVWLRNVRRYAVVVIFIVAAILTPSPDFVSQLVLALPLWLLYEIGIIISRRAEKRKELEELA